MAAGALPDCAARLASLRAELAKRRLDGFVVPLSDEHQGEYVAPYAMRLAWLTGFTGSAGQAIVLADEAALFVDGRYTLQAREQVDSKLYTLRHVSDEPAADWLEAKLKKGARLGYDSSLHTERQVEALTRACAKAGASLVGAPRNPVDAIWRDQPPPPLGLVRVHPLDLAGEDSKDKRARIAATLKSKGVRAAALTAPDSIAWLLNIRGGDIAYNPVALAFAILSDDGRADLFIDRRKLSPEVVAHLGSEVAIRPPQAFIRALAAFRGEAVLADPVSAPYAVMLALKRAKARVVREDDPCVAPKARKNGVELAGMRAAHIRDGAALCRFLAWLARESPSGRIDEIGAARVLEEFRASEPLFRDLSFATISGAGANGAIVHYRASEASNRRLEPGMLYLVDSGAQYADGTTDVTRTVAIGAPTDEMRDRYTRVLKGHVAIARCRFVRGTTGSQIDALARRALWEAGLDYDHGTGHGVGSHLSVHEGPQRISKIGNAVALEPGMVISNEPGYYKEGAYGIRIENLVAVRPGEAIPGGERPVLSFETLTLAPYDSSLIDLDLLDPGERAFIDAYHARVRDMLAPRLDAETARWLEAATRPLP